MKQLILLFVLSSSLIIAQDRVLMLNGREFSTKIIDTTFLNVTIQDKPNTKPFDLERYRIFSINWDSKESILYKQDTLIGNFYNEHEMRMFVYGEKDAHEHYKSPLTFTGGVILGLIGGYVQPYVMSEVFNNNLLARPIFSPIIPIGYCFVVGSRWIRINKKDVSNSLYLSEDTYLEGFDREARGKKIQKAIWGSITGLVSGIALSYIIAIN